MNKMMPCGGDAFEAAEHVDGDCDRDGLPVVAEITVTSKADGCLDCAKGVSNGGKCDGGERHFYMLNCLYVLCGGR